MPLSKTIIISCAGVGSRLGFGHTKTLLKIGGKSIIHHHLDQLKEFDDVRIVVGYGAKDVINTVIQHRKNVMFIFNHRYAETTQLTTLELGAQHARPYIVSIDGDLLVDPKDLKNFLQEKNEVMGYIKAYSDEPVYATIKKIKNKEYITGFNREQGKYEWTGLIQIKKDKITNTKGKFVYELVKDFLPIRGKYINCREIDTPNDYEKALQWAKEAF